MELQKIENDEISPYYRVKIALIGATSVGKSTMVNLLNNNESDRFTESTIGIDFVCKTFQLEEYPIKTAKSYYYDMLEKYHLPDREHQNKKLQTIKAHVYDTAGSLKFRQLILSNYVKDVDIIFLCFAMNDRNSWDEILKWKEEIDERRREGSSTDNAPMYVLVGTKSDLSPYEVSITEIEKRCEEFCKEKEEKVEKQGKQGTKIKSFIISSFHKSAPSTIRRMFYVVLREFHDRNVCLRAAGGKIPHHLTVAYQEKQNPSSSSFSVHSDIPTNKCCIIS